MRWIATAGHFDVVIADPPYDFDAWELLQTTADATVLVAESNAPIVVVEPWGLLRERTYGSTVVTIISGPDFGS